MAAWSSSPPPLPSPPRPHLRRLLIVPAFLLFPSLLLTALAPARASGQDIGEIGVSWNAEDVDVEVRDMQRAGLTWVRTGFQFDWKGQPTSYEWIDSIVASTAAHHIKMVLAVYGTPRNDLGNDADREAYKRWLKGMVHRYKDRVRVWEVGNEPNLQEYWNIPGKPGDPSWNDGVHRYVQHLGDTYGAIKSEDPTATVLLGGLSQYRAVEYIDQLISERVNGKPAYHYFDAMNLHPYGDTPDDVVAEVQAVQQRMAAVPGLAAKALWITEFGWQTSWKGYHRYVATEETKGRYLVQSIRKLRAIGIRTPIIIYAWRDDGFTRQDVGNGNGSGFGLTTKRPQTVFLPAFYQLQLMTRESPSPQQGERFSFTSPAALWRAAVGLGIVLLGVTFIYVRRRWRKASGER